jgi:hypothetical protein
MDTEAEGANTAATTGDTQDQVRPDDKGQVSRLSRGVR